MVLWMVRVVDVGVGVYFLCCVVGLYFIFCFFSLFCLFCFFFFFFFQAEDGIRDLTVTGVQTCALPIYSLAHQAGERVGFAEIRRVSQIRQHARAHGGVAVAGAAVPVIGRLARLDRKSVV